MNINPHSSGIANILRTEIEAWRRAGNVSREAVAIQVMDAHEQLGGEASTGVDFSFAGDAYTQAKKGAQKLFRWLDVDGTLPAGIVQSILFALPGDVRLHCLNQMFRPLGAEAHASKAVQPGTLDVSTHLRSMIKESSEAQMALVSLGSQPTAPELRAALKEVREEREAAVCAEHAIEAALAGAEGAEAVC